LTPALSVCQVAVVLLCLQVVDGFTEPFHLMDGQFPLGKESKKEKWKKRGNLIKKLGRSF